MNPYRRSRGYADESYDSHAPHGRNQHGSDSYRRRPRPVSPGRRSYDDHPDRVRGRYHDRDQHDHHQHRWDSRGRDHFDRSVEDPYAEPPRPLPINGEKDVSTDGRPIRFLLIRDLKPNVDEALFARGVEKLCRIPAVSESTAPESSASEAPVPVPATVSGAAPGSLKRIFLIRDRVTNESAGFGFIEFVSNTEAAAALSRAEELGSRCTISSKEITVTFPHFGVFMPVDTRVTAPRYTFIMREGEAFEYHDKGYYASELVVNAEPPTPPQPEPEPAAPPKLPLHKTGKKRPITNLLDSDTDKTAKKPKTAVPSVVANLTAIQVRNRGNYAAGEDESDLHTISLSGANDGEYLGKQSFVYTGPIKGKDQTTCLLCATVIPADKAVQHCQASKKHLANLADGAKVQEGYDRLKEHGIPTRKTIKLPGTETPVPAPYLDRAAERRQKEGSEPFKMSLKPANAGSAFSTAAPAPLPSTPLSRDEQLQTTYGKGMALLQKAGFKPGQDTGLGSDGIATPITQNAYAAGVGLGHEQSNLGDALEVADRNAKEAKTYGERARDAARERFEKMTKDAGEGD